MNKKLKIFLALTLVIQLLVPSFLLIHHYSVLSTAKNLETEYKFELSHLAFDDRYVHENSFAKIEDGALEFDIAEGWRISKAKVTPVLSPQNNVITLQELKDNDKTDVWFYYRYYRQNSTIEPERFSFEPGVDKGSVKLAIRTEYYNYKVDAEEKEPAYLTAKIYKGVFIPTAIYFRGEKIISINL